MRRRTAAILAGAAVALATLAPFTAQAYYHFVRYGSRVGPFVQIPEKFDLNALVDKTVYFLISEQGPSVLVAGDSFASLASQIGLAAKSWNDVPSSELRVAFGGYFTPGAPSASPVVEVLFDEVPPGLVAYGGPATRGEIVNGPSGPFVPIQKSVVVLRRDLTGRPSWSEALFLSIAHEFGHALGLQHSLTSGLMSTELTRATTKARPLAADDVAGLSLLYPTPSFLASTGSISGRVAAGAESINLASVVALAPDGAAVSAITNPDGTYRIQGLPPGGYYVYVHPLPPAFAGESFPANITPPSDPDGRLLPSIGSFETSFYPGAKDPAAAALLPVSAGSSVEGIDFQVQRRAAPPVYAVQTFSFPAQVAVKPAHISNAYPRNFVVATGVGLTAGGSVAPGLNVGVVGGSATLAPGGVKTYVADARYLQLDMLLHPIPGEGPRHLLFRAADNDIYVLPGGFRVVGRIPPSISAVSQSADGNGARVVLVSGAGLAADTQILFDGVPGVVRSFDGIGTLTVAPPPGNFGHRAAVTAVNRDGQSSLFIQGNAVPVYEYDGSEPGAVTIAPSTLPAGVETMVEILGAGTSFAAGKTSVHFGTADIAVRRVWVTGPDRLLANVMVAAGAPFQTTTVTVQTGLREIRLPFGVAVGPGGLRSLRGPFTDAASGRMDIPAGAAAAIRLSGVAPELPLAAIQVQVADHAAQAVSYSGGMLTFQVPNGLAPGPAPVRVAVSGEALPALALSVDVPPPVIASVFAGTVRIDGQRPARPGELLTINVTGLADPGAEISATRLRVYIAGLTHAVVQTGATANGHQVQILLDAGLPGALHPMTVSIDGRMSPAYSLPVVRP
jgi:hypothetical protein